VKTCKKCGIEQPLTNFYADKRIKNDGLQGRCKTCCRQYQKDQYRKNQQRQRERKKKYYHANKENRRTYITKNREKHRGWVSAWQKKNPEKTRGMRQRTSARRRSNYQGSFTAAEWTALCAFYDNRCCCCGATAPLTVDHIVPVSQGGTSDISNIQALCSTCNARKGAKTINYRWKGLPANGR
jgi:5-methylcytosine-specific restriction endonuclease McrA